MIQIDPVLQDHTNVKWEMDGNENICDEPNIERQGMTRFSSSTLILNDVSEKDVGTYTCHTKNDVESCSVNNTLYKLNAVSKDVTNVKFEEGKDKTFNCNIEVGYITSIILSEYNI